MLNLSTYLMLRADVEGDIEKTVEATRCDNNTDNALFFFTFFSLVTPVSPRRRLTRGMISLVLFLHLCFII